MFVRLEEIEKTLFAKRSHQNICIACKRKKGKTDHPMNLSEIAADFTLKLNDTEAQEKDTVSLSCEVSKPDVMVDWLLNQEILKPSDKYNMEQDGTTHTLTIQEVSPDDSGTYTARCGGNETSASLTIKGIIY